MIRVRAALRSSEVRSLATNSLWLFTDRFLRLAVMLVVTGWTARYLGPEHYGELASIYAYLTLFQCVASLGLDGICIRELAVNPGKAQRVIGTTIMLRSITGAACFFVSVALYAVTYGARAPETWMCALAAGSMLFSSVDTLGLWFQASNQNRKALVPRFVAFLVTSAIKIAFILGEVPYRTFAVTQSIEALLTGLALCQAYRASGQSMSFAYHSRLARALLREMLPYLVSSVAVCVYMRIDQLMILHFLGYEAVGNYAAAMPISAVWYTIPTTLQIVLAPYLARTKVRSEAEYMRAFVAIFRGFGIIALIVSAATAFAAPTLITIFYGSRYEQAPAVLAIHAFTNFFVFQGIAQQIWIINERAGAMTFWRTTSGMVASVLTNWILLPWIGLPGAAIAALISYGVSSVFSNAILCPEILLMQFGIAPFGKRKAWR